MHSLAALALWCSTVCAVAGNWPAWRGPDHDGVTPEPLAPNFAETVKWKVPLPEPGNSTATVWGDRVFLTQAAGAKRLLMCFSRKDGAVLWQQGPVVDGKEPTHGTNPYCAGSAATDGERVVAWFGRAGLWCWDMDGRVLWQKDLGVQEHIWGYAASPALTGDLCVLNFGPGKRSFVIAVDKKSGADAWRFEVPRPAVVEGPGDPAKDFIGSWNSGVPATIGGRAEFIISLPGAVWSLAPSTGKPLWHCSGLNPLAYAEPLITKNAIVGFGGYSGYSIGIRPGGNGDITATHRLWQEKKNPQRIGSGVTLDGLGFFTGEPGVIQCVDVATGAEKWKQRLGAPGGRSQSWSSLLRSGETIFAVTQSTAIIAFRASAERYDQLGMVDLQDGRTNSSLAVSDGNVFLRTDRTLWCFGK